MSSTAEAGSGHCTHGSLISSYGWAVQSVLASIAFACLIVKRFCEPRNYRRSWMVWLCDTSKQGFGAIVVHFSNIVLAELVDGQDPCTLYIITFLLDSSVGLFLLWLMIRWTEWFAVNNNYQYLVPGEYGKPRPKTKYWVIQCLAYIAIVVIDKLVITLLLQFGFWSDVRALLLWPTERFLNKQIELVIVLLVIPFFVNVLMFWVTDNFLIGHRVRQLKHKPSSAQSDPIVGFATTAGSQTAPTDGQIFDEDAELIDISFEPDYSDNQNIL